MNISEYIKSGAIEAYVLGLCSEQEKAEFEKLCNEYPELKEARIAFEISLEQKAFANAIAPPSFLKEKILETIKQEVAVDSVKNIIATKPATVKSLVTRKLAMAASVIIILGLAGLLFYLYNNNKKLESEVAKSKDAIEKIKQQNAPVQADELPGNATIQQVKVETPKNIPATIEVFWDSTNTNVYLVVRDLEKLPVNQKYELWSVVDGKYNSLGLFDAPKDNRLILKLNNSQKADAFSVSIAEVKK